MFSSLFCFTAQLPSLFEPRSRSSLLLLHLKPKMSPPSSLDVIHAYRNLYRASLHAVQYSKPNRYTVRNQLRRSFRKEHPLSFNPAKIERTIEFLKLAASERGLEHRVVKSLLHTKWWYYDHLKKGYATTSMDHIALC